jgi:hypothetical protein
MFRRDATFQRRRPTRNPDVPPAPREQITLRLLGTTVDLVPKGSFYVARHDAPELLAQPTSGASWLIWDGHGFTYSFTGFAQLSGAGMYLLTSIDGPGGNHVAVSYTFGAPALPSTAKATVAGVSVDLAMVTYNTHPTAADCPKNELVLAYGPDAATPLSISMVGTVALARVHIEVGARSA